MYPHIVHQPNRPILDVNGLDVRYGGRAALDDVTFQLRPGERVAVVGPNGAGKSTLLKVIAGVLPPTSGQVSVFGSDPDKHVCIAYIPQRSQVDWRFPVTVGDVVMMGRSARLRPFIPPSKSDWAKVYEALRMVEMDDLADRQIGELSGGQQQRMFIARALAQEADLVLLDEPLTGLDAPAQENLLALLTRLQERRVTVMAATHDLEQAARYFDRIMLLNKEVIGFGSPEEVLQPNKLLRAYGGRLRRLDAEGAQLTLDDTCCDGGAETPRQREAHEHGA